MPKIKTPNGYIKYKTTPIYYGIKLIDKDKAFKNLLIAKEVLEMQKIPFQLAYGTLLGAIRDKDFITHDEDIDLIILEEYKQEFIDALPALISKGFAIARYDRRGLLSLIKDDEYIDFYFFKKEDNEFRTCSGVFCFAKHIEETTTYNFKGVDFSVPKDYEDFFLFEYGENWRTPIQWLCYKVSSIQRLKFKVKELLKDSLPEWAYLKLAIQAERRMTRIYNEKLERYYHIKNITPK